MSSEPPPLTSGTYNIFQILEWDEKNPSKLQMRPLGFKVKGKGVIGQLLILPDNSRDFKPADFELRAQEGEQNAFKIFVNGNPINPVKNHVECVPLDQVVAYVWRVERDTPKGNSFSISTYGPKSLFWDPRDYWNDVAPVHLQAIGPLWGFFRNNNPPTSSDSDSDSELGYASVGPNDDNLASISAGGPLELCLDPNASESMSAESRDRRPSSLCSVSTQGSGALFSDSDEEVASVRPVHLVATGSTRLSFRGKPPGKFNSSSIQTSNMSPSVILTRVLSRVLFRKVGCYKVQPDFHFE